MLQPDKNDEVISCCIVQTAIKAHWSTDIPGALFLVFTPKIFSSNIMPKNFFLLFIKFYIVFFSVLEEKNQNKLGK